MQCRVLFDLFLTSPQPRSSPAHATLAFPLHTPTLLFHLCPSPSPLSHPFLSLPHIYCSIKSLVLTLRHDLLVTFIHTGTPLTPPILPGAHFGTQHWRSGCPSAQHRGTITALVLLATVGLTQSTRRPLAYVIQILPFLSPFRKSRFILGPPLFFIFLQNTLFILLCSSKQLKLKWNFCNSEELST